jgi:hypothetical protein
MGYGERSLGVLHAEKNYKDLPHAYSIPSTLENKKGYNFRGGGRYVPSP